MNDEELHLNLEDKDMAQKRHEYMKDFLEEYYLETGYRYEG